MQKKQFWSEIWKRKEPNRNAESINNKKWLQEFEVSPEADVHLDSRTVTLKNYQTGKRQENPNCTDKRRNRLLAWTQRTILEEQKGCRKGIRGTDDLLYIDQHILQEAKIRQKNVDMA